MIMENVFLAISSLRSNKMRALLTMLGIIIGIASIISIVIIGDAMTASVTNSLSSFGANNITASIQEKVEGVNEEVFSDGFVVMYQSSSSGKIATSQDLITDKMISGIKESFSSEVKGISLFYPAGQGQAKDGDAYANVTISGVNADYAVANTFTMLNGRFITDKDVKQNSQTAVVSDKFVNNMFLPGVDPIGKQVKIYKSTSIEIYTIVGVYQYEQLGYGGSTLSEKDISTTFYIPVTTAKQDNIEKNYDFITIVGNDGVDINTLTNKIQQYFDRLYVGNKNWKISVTNMTSMLQAVSEALGSISIAIAFIAGISLLVGGIGVMNIMLVSVTERTREIGTRKALGAKNYHIQLQFVTEALIISLVGGVIGLLLGIGVGVIVSIVFEAPLIVSPPVVAGSVLFSMFIGVFFGFYPANKAAKLDPIEALRYE